MTAFQTSELERLRTEELPRMERVMANFSILMKVEVALPSGGLMLAVFFLPSLTLRGLAFGLVLLGAMLYVFDHCAAARGKPHVEYLKGL